MADLEMPRWPRGRKQIPEGLDLVGSDVGENHAVDDATRNGGRVGPNHLCIHLNGTALRLQTEVYGSSGRKALGQLHTSPPFAQVEGPAHLGSVSPEGVYPIQEGEVG